MRIVAIGLGNQRSPDDLRDLLESGPIIARHGATAAAWLGAGFTSVVNLDSILDSDEVARIPDLVAAEFDRVAGRSTSVCYLVPEAGYMADATVERLADDYEVDVIPGAIAVGQPLAQCCVIDALSLAIAEAEHPFDAGLQPLDPSLTTIVTNYNGVRVRELANSRLRRELRPATGRQLGNSLIFDGRSEPEETPSFGGLEHIVATLRSPSGCPWDREQTVASLLPQLVEELDEFQEACESGSASEQAEELGDVLLHIVMISQIARESGAFTSSDVIRSISSKMVRRHPHVFGDVEIESFDELYRMWDEIKDQEKLEASEGADAS